MFELEKSGLKPIPEAYSNMWEILKTKHKDLFGLLSRMTTSFVIRNHRDTAFQARADLSITDFLGRRFGLDAPRSSASELARELGMTSNGVDSLTQGILGYVSQETGLTFSSASGINAIGHVKQFSGLVQEQRTLEERMRQGIPPIDHEAIRLYLLGYRHNDLAVKLNKDLALTPPVSKSLVKNIVDQALGKVKYRTLHFLTANALKARTLLRDTKEGSYRNHKAEATVRVLGLMEEKCTQSEIVEETGIRSPHFNALVNEAFIDLGGDELGREDLADAYRMISEEPFVPLSKNGRNQVARLLHEPYKKFRVRLGDKVANSGELIHNCLSLRERTILESISAGLTSREIATRFGLCDTYYTAVSRWLLGETNFVSRSDLLEERRKIYTRLQDDIVQGKPLPGKLLTFAGLPSTSVLELLASGCLIDQTAQNISELTGLTVSRHDVMSLIARVRAHYRS